jgi:hypothetical protein
MSYKLSKESYNSRIENNQETHINYEYYNPSQISLSQPYQEVSREKFEHVPDESSEINLGDNDMLNIEWVIKKNINTKSPSAWGSAFWYTFHASSLSYPISPNKIYKNRMRNFILSIPFILPCESCRVHSISYIESRKDELDTIVSSKENLFKFFVDFHNVVSSRLGKKTFTYDEAKNLYEKGVNLSCMKYK